MHESEAGIQKVTNAASDIHEPGRGRHWKMRTARGHEKNILRPEGGVERKKMTPKLHFYRRFLIDFAFSYTVTMMIDVRSQPYNIELLTIRFEKKNAYTPIGH